MRIPWFVPLLDDEDLKAVQDVIISGFINQGPENTRIENMLRAYFGVDYAVLTPNGTSAIALSLMALGIGPGDSVLVPDVTFIGTASAVRLTGAEVILVDVKKDDYTIDPVDLLQRIRPNTRAILPVHLTGRSADMEALRDIARQYNLLIVEDAAEALGAKNNEGFLGTQSAAGCFSLAPTKIITSGQGGFVLTTQRDVYEKIVRLKDHGRLSRASDIHPVVGYNFKLTDLQAALAASQFEKLDSRIRRIREIDALYVEGLSDVPEIRFPARPPPDSYLMWPDFESPRRNELVAYLKDRAIELRPFWPALHTQPAYACDSGFPGSSLAAAQACWLPASPGLTNEGVLYVMDGIRSFFGQGKS